MKTLRPHTSSGSSKRKIYALIPNQPQIRKREDF